MPNLLRTTGDVISATMQFYLNKSGGASLSDEDVRRRLEYELTAVLSDFWAMTPGWWKTGSGTVVLTNGLGAMPTDFSHFADEGQVYIQGEHRGPLLQVSRDAIEALRITGQGNPGLPSCYCLIGDPTTGLPSIRCYPENNGTLDLRAYVKEVPLLVDRPTAPTLAVSATVGLPAGSYSGKATFVTALGETETGEASVTVTASLLQLDWPDIPISQNPYVIARNLYRPVAGGSLYKLAATVADNVTTSFTGDNASDIVLAAAASAPTTLTAVTGMERLPDPYLMEQGLRAYTMESQSDARAGKAKKAWEEAIQRLFADLQQGQNRPRSMPRYGSQLRATGVPYYNLRRI